MFGNVICVLQWVCYFLNELLNIYSSFSVSQYLHRYYSHQQKLFAFPNNYYKCEGVLKTFENCCISQTALRPHVLKSRPHVEGGKFTCRLESCVKAFSQPGCTHLYGLSPVWILHGMRKQERERMSARPLGDWLLNKPQGHSCPPTGVGAV